MKQKNNLACVTAGVHKLIHVCTYYVYQYESWDYKKIAYVRNKGLSLIESPT